MGMVVKAGDADDHTCEKETINLTVRKTSLFFAGDGFTAYDANCQLVFRVDSYGGPDNRDRNELFLMDATGHCLLTVRRKRPSLHQRWEGYAGEGRDGSKPIFSVRRSSIIGRSSVTVEVYGEPGAEYLIEGSFPQRNCTFYDLASSTGGGGGRSVVAKIRQKIDASTNMRLGKDVFVLSLKPGFDAAFTMGIVLVLDQISDDDDDRGNGGEDQEEGLKADPTVHAVVEEEAEVGP